MTRHRTCVGLGRCWRALLSAAGALLLLSACAGTGPDPRIAQAPVFDHSETFVSNTAPVPQWTDVVARYDAALQSPDQVPAEWQHLVAKMRGFGMKQKIERVNAEINRYPYVASEQNWGRPDYWETPFEFLANAGQCQDYAATKYFLLRAAGVPADDLQVVVVRDSETRLDHAVVIVDPHGEALLLDNQIKHVAPFASAHRYTPLYALNETGWWVFKARATASWPVRFAQARF